MKSCLLFFLLLFSALAMAQDPAINFVEHEKIIKKLIASQPDSAKVLIKQILNYKGGAHDTIYANANIFYGFYHNLKNDLDSSLYYYNKAERYTEGFPAHYARVLRNKASIYRKKTDYNYSLKLLSIAEQKYQELDNAKGLATVYGEIASNYNQMLQSDKAIPYLLKAIKLAEQTNDAVTIAPLKQSLANTYMNMGNHEFAIELYEDVLPVFKGKNQMKNYYLTLINYSECLIGLKRYEAAKKSLLASIAGLEQFSDNELTGRAYGSLGRIDIVQRKFLQGLHYHEKAFGLLLSVNSAQITAEAVWYLSCLEYFDDMKRALEVVTLTDNCQGKNKANLQDLAAYEKIKIVIYQKAENSGLALKSAKTTIELLDTLDKIVDKKTIIAMQAEIQQEYQSKKSDTLTKANSVLKEAVRGGERKKWLWIYLPLMVLTALALYYFYKRSKHKKMISEKKSEISEIGDQQRSASLLNESLKTDIDERDAELVSAASAMSKMQQSVNAMIELVSKGTPTDNKPDIGSLSKELGSIMEEKDYWPLFRKSFNEANAGFQEKFSSKYPELTKKELFFFSLVKLSLPNKDLAMILQITPDAVKRKKNRLRKKVEKEPGDDLESILNNM